MNPIVISVGVIACLVIVYLISVIFQIKLRDDEYGLDLIGGSRGNKMVELFESNPASIKYGMGPLSNIRFKLRSGNHTIKPNVPLIRTRALYVPSGTPLPLQPSISDEGSSNGPSVEGDKISPKSMTMFKYNRCLPECCPGTYSCSGGCICQTNKQAKFINRRGNNRTPPSEY